MYNMKYDINVDQQKCVCVCVCMCMCVCVCVCVCMDMGHETFNTHKGISYWSDGFKLTGFKSGLLTNDHGNDHEK